MRNVNSTKKFNIELNQTNNESPKEMFRLHIGSSSILLIFVILCLVSFGALALVSANADKKLTNKVLNRTTTYYEACNEAENSLSKLDSILSSSYKTSGSEEEYFNSVGKTKTITVPLTDKQFLTVEVEILYPTNDNEPFYQITNYSIQTNN